jgi:hypothetical protein
MTYIICIPSYKRSDVCNDKTLTTLKNNNIPKKLINVFVANKTEYNKYHEVLNKNLYNKLIIGKKGLVQQRQFIINMYKEGENIVFFDDDISNIDLSMSSEFKNHSLDFFFKSAFNECKKQKSYIWGVYPVFNPFFREGRPELSRDLRYIVGAFYGIINRPKLKAIQLTITKSNGQKEDVERTLRYFDHDRIVLRFDKVGFETKYYGKEGGLGTFEARLKPMEEATKKLLEKYPDYGSMIKKKTGMTEFKFKKIPAFTEKGGSGTTTGIRLPLNITDEYGQKLHVPVENINGELVYGEDEPKLTKVRSQGQTPIYNPNWKNIDETAIAFYRNHGGKKEPPRNDRSSLNLYNNDNSHVNPNEFLINTNNLEDNVQIPTGDDLLNTAFHPSQNDQNERDTENHGNNNNFSIFDENLTPDQALPDPNAGGRSKRKTRKNKGKRRRTKKKSLKKRRKTKRKGG